MATLESRGDVTELAEIDKGLASARRIVADVGGDMLREYVKVLLDEIVLNPLQRMKRQTPEGALASYFNGTVPLVLSEQGWGKYFSQLKSRTKLDEQFTEFVRLFNAELQQRGFHLRLYAEHGYECCRILNL